MIKVNSNVNYKVNTDGLNFRRGPGTSHNILSTLTYGNRKKRAKEAINNIKDEKINEKNLIIDDYNHENNMKYRMLFLINIIPKLYPNFDFFSLMKEICLVDPIFESDKSFFYDFMEKFISEGNKDNIEDSNEERIEIKQQLFNMLGNENKNSISSNQFNLYIKLFLDINQHKKYLNFFKPNANYIYLSSS